MLNRRKLLAGSIALIGTTLSDQSHAHHSAKYKKRFKLDRKYEPQTVFYPGRYGVGTIIVDPANHFLYLAGRPGLARRYGVGVGRAGLAFKGSATIERKAEWPSWTPTQNMIRREPEKYAQFADGVPGGINNPLGARALYLYKGSRDTYYRIHGTTQPSSIGQSVSNGCIRMINDHVIDLYNRVPLGTRVVVL
ncbi:MAG: L,D-transpeptidase [Rhizobiaceae bacterium]